MKPVDEEDKCAPSRVHIGFCRLPELRMKYDALGSLPISERHSLPLGTPEVAIFESADQRLLIQPESPRPAGAVDQLCLIQPGEKECQIFVKSATHPISGVYLRELGGKGYAMPCREPARSGDVVILATVEQIEILQVCTRNSNRDVIATQRRNFKQEQFAAAERRCAVCLHPCTGDANPLVKVLNSAGDKALVHFDCISERCKKELCGAVTSLVAGKSVSASAAVNWVEEGKSKEVCLRFEAAMAEEKGKYYSFNKLDRVILGNRTNVDTFARSELGPAATIVRAERDMAVNETELWTCSICQDSKRGTADNPRVAVCHCPGAKRYVHYGCLKTDIESRRLAPKAATPGYTETEELFHGKCDADISRTIGLLYEPATSVYLLARTTKIAKSSQKVSAFDFSAAAPEPMHQNERRFVVGRSRGGLRFENTNVSGTHLYFAYNADSDTIFIEDAKSTYGTIVKRIGESFLVRPGEKRVFLFDNLYVEVCFDSDPLA